MNLNSYKIAIEELEAVRDSIDKQIQQLREENGADMAEIFDKKFKGAVEDLEQLIEDRCENEDVHTLWEIEAEIRRLDLKILNTLRGFQEA